VKITLAAYEKRNINNSGGIFTVLSVDGLIELSAKGIEDIPLENSDQINIGDVRQISLQNMTDESAVIDYVIGSASTDKKSQRTQVSGQVQSEITNAIDIASMPAVQVEATVSAANDASDVTTVTLQPNETKQILAINNSRHSASVVRGEMDLYNIKLGYNTALNAQNGVPFAPQASAIIRTKAALWAHNHSAVAQTVIAVETNINTGV